MEYRQFGKTDLKISAIGFGCWEIGGTYGRIDESQFQRAVHEAIDSGTAMIGSPKTVLAGIERMRERTGFGILVALLQFGILSDELTRRNMDMFATEVMPKLRD